MSQISQFLKEVEKEATTTRKMLSIVPTDKFDWAPHPKSMPMGKLALHIAELPTWIDMVLKTPELDFAAEPYTPSTINNTNDLVAFFEKNLVTAKEGLNAAKEKMLDDVWTLRNGEQVYSKEPKADVIRMSLSQIIHHRAQLGVFLRLLDIPIPGSYGPSADDMSF